MTVERFPFAFDRRFAPLLAVIGARQGNSEVIVGDATLDVRFGRLRVRTPVSNIERVQITRDYRWFKTIGARASLADRGATFGSNTRAGVCVRFHEPVAALAGKRRIHPGLTVTVADPEGLLAALRQRIDTEPEP